MSKIGTRKTKLGELVKGEILTAYSYAYKIASITVDPTDTTQPAEIGCVYNVDGTPLTKAEAAALVGTEKLYVLADDRVDTDLTVGARNLAVIDRGPIVIGKAVLKPEGEAAYSSAELAKIVTCLEAMGVQVGEQV